MSGTRDDNKGKSVLFLFVILAGYVSGIAHKLLFNHDFIIYLYALNGAMVLTDILLFYRNKRMRKPLDDVFAKLG